MKKIILNNWFMIKYLIKICPKFVTLSILNAFFKSCISIANILYLRYLVQFLEDRQSLNKIVILLLLMLIVNLVYSLFVNYYTNILEKKSTKILSQKIKIELFLKIYKMDYQLYEDFNFYNKITNVAEQSEKRALEVLAILTSILTNLLSISALLSLIGFLDPLIILISIVSVVFSMAFNSKISKTQYEYYGSCIPIERYLGIGSELFFKPTFAKELRMYSGLTNLFIDKFKDATEKYLFILKKFGKKIFILQNLSSFSLVLTDSIINLYLVVRVFGGFLNFSDFITLNGSANQLIESISTLLNIVPKIYENSLYIDDLRNMLIQEDVSTVNSKHEIEIVQSIEFKNVSFSYLNASENSISNVNFIIKKGEKIAIVGENGAGKSTIIKLLCGLYNDYSGEILYNGLILDKLNLQDIQEKIGVVFQEIKVFPVTIIENILMRPIENRLNDEEKVKCILKKVGLFDKVFSLPLNIYTPLTKEYEKYGTIFSSGEYQKLILGRLYAKNVDIIVLDEPSSSLDAIAEKEIFKIVDNVFYDKARIYISHRLANIFDSDKIIYIENGLVSELGSHDNLIKMKGKYFDLYSIQSNGYETIE